MTEMPTTTMSAPVTESAEAAALDATATAMPQTATSQTNMRMGKVVDSVPDASAAVRTSAATTIPVTADASSSHTATRIGATAPSPARPSPAPAHGAPNARHGARGRRDRNSSVELLRILAMLMIVTSHGVMFSALDVTAQPFGVNKVLVETFLYSGGKVGVVAFFAISSWYLSEAGGVRVGLRRVWLLEREMLFWSLTLLAASVAAHALGHGPAAPDVALIARSALPTVTALWWYPTAYAVFLLFFPFLTRGLRALDRTTHRALCVVMITLWTVLDMVMPLSGVGLPGGNWLSFVYIHTLITYYRWHMTANRPVRARTAWLALVAGYLMIAAGTVVGGLLFARTGRLETLQVYLGKVEFRLPVLLIGLALFALFERGMFHSAAVNVLAGSTFGVYLISEYPTVRAWLWHDGPLAGVLEPALLRSPWAVPVIVGVACAVFAACAALDQLRALLFRVTVDRRRGRWFDLLSGAFLRAVAKKAR